jgi:alpha-beta hydrolase superfamily lysophospholipase
VTHQHKKTPGLLSRARHCVTACGYTVAAIDAPGHGDRPRTTQDERARAGLRQALAAGESERFKSISVRYGISLAERAIPEWQATLDALQKLPEIGAQAPVGYGGGITLGTAIGIPLTAVEPRITAAIFGGGFVVHESLIEAARRVTVPVQFLLPWDDEYVDRQSALALFDAFASQEKTLHAKPGDHRNVRWLGVDDSFLARHLGRAGTSPTRCDG